MSTCGSCNTPASSGGNLPAQPSAYLTNPLTATPDTCSQAVANPCSVPVSSRSYLVDYIPGWLQKVTAAASGKLLIARGSVLHFFKGANPGPLYFDGEEVTVAEQPTLPLAATEQSILERGWNVIARKVKRPKVMPNGTVVEKEFFDIGVQALREETTGELPVLVIDPTSGMSRVDVADVTEHNLVKDGIPTGLQVLGYQTERVDGGCGQIDRKKFLALSGAIWQEDEILRNQPNGLPAILVPRDGDCNGSNYVLGTQQYVENEEGLSIEDENKDAYRLPIALPIYGNADCPTQITGVRVVNVPVPDHLFSDFVEDEREGEIAAVTLASLTGAGTNSLEENYQITGEDGVEGIPDDAKFVKVRIYASCGTRVSGTPSATATVGNDKNPAGFDPIEVYSVTASDYTEGGGSQSSDIFYIELKEDGSLDVKLYLVGNSLGSGTRVQILGWRR